MSRFKGGLNIILRDALCIILQVPFPPSVIRMFMALHIHCSRATQNSTAGTFHRLAYSSAGRCLNPFDCFLILTNAGLHVFLDL